MLSWKSQIYSVELQECCLICSYLYGWTMRRQSLKPIFAFSWFLSNDNALDCLDFEPCNKPHNHPWFRSSGGAMIPAIVYASEENTSLSLFHPWPITLNLTCTAWIHLWWRGWTQRFLRWPPGADVEVAKSWQSTSKMACRDDWFVFKVLNLSFVTFIHIHNQPMHNTELSTEQPETCIGWAAWMIPAGYIIA